MKVRMTEKLKDFNLLNSSCCTRSVKSGHTVMLILMSLFLAFSVQCKMAYQTVF